MSYKDDYDDLMKQYDLVLVKNQELIESYNIEIENLSSVIIKLEDNLSNSINVNDLVHRMQIDGKYTEDFESWFKNYLRFYTEYDKIVG